MTAPPCSFHPLLRQEEGYAEGGGWWCARREPPRPLRGHPSSREEGKAGIRAQSRPRRLPLKPELDHAPRHGFRLLHVREMARFRDLLQFRSGNGRAEALAVR